MSVHLSFVNYDTINLRAAPQLGNVGGVRDWCHCYCPHLAEVHVTRLERINHRTRLGTTLSGLADSGSSFVELPSVVKPSDGTSPPLRPRRARRRRC